MTGKAPRGAAHSTAFRSPVPLAVLFAALCTGLLALVGCAAPGVGRGAPSPVPGPPVSTPDGYQDLLNQTNDQLAGALTAIGAAPSLDALDQAVLAAAGVASSASERLAGSGPVPAAVSGENAALAGSLRQFGRELAYLSQQIDLHAICAGPTALTAISTAPTMPDLRAIGVSMGTPRSDRPAYRWGAALPAAKDPVHTTLPNGELLLDRRAGASGDGVLRVTNDGTKDAVLMLAKGGAVVLSVAVDAGRAARLDGVPDGDYDLYYTTGKDWDRSLSTFSRHCEFHRFTTPTTFRTSPVATGSAYTVQTIAVHTVGDDGSGPVQDPAANPAAAPGGVPGAANSPGTAVVPPDQLPR